MAWLAGSSLPQAAHAPKNLKALPPRIVLAHGDSFQLGDT
jgi:hypothetical protein